MLIVMVRDDGSFQVRSVDPVSQAVEDVTKDYELSFVDLEDGGEKKLTGFHVGWRVEREKESGG